MVTQLTPEERASRRKTARHRYNTSEKGRAAFRRKQALLVSTPEGRLKYNARKAVSLNLKYGKIQRKPCEVCGGTEKINGHHENYLMPLSIIWLCEVHHQQRHMELRNKMERKPERDFRAKVRKDLKKLQRSGAPIFLEPITQKSIVGTPDFLMSVAGKFIGLELKAEDGHASKVQEIKLAEIAKAGGLGILARPSNWPDVLQLITDLSTGEKK